jgi:molybdopterin synthase sulfur carrier subunit
MIRVVLPTHLRRLAGVEREMAVEVEGVVTLESVLNALEAACPSLRGTIRDQATGQRRAFLRFFAVKQDLSQQALDIPLPQEVACGDEPLRVVGAIAGG